MKTSLTPPQNFSAPAMGVGGGGGGAAGVGAPDEAAGAESKVPATGGEGDEGGGDNGDQPGLAGGHIGDPDSVPPRAELPVIDEVTAVEAPVADTVLVGAAAAAEAAGGRQRGACADGPGLGVAQEGAAAGAGGG